MSVKVRAVIKAAINGSNEVHLSTDMKRLHPDLIPSVFGALGHHLGLNAVALEKAARRDHAHGPDPRYPDLPELIRSARRDWSQWGEALVEEIGALLADGKLLPMTPAAEAMLFDLLNAHQVRISARFSGHFPDPRAIRREVRAKHLPKTYQRTSYAEIAYRVGRSRDQTAPHRPTAARPLAVIVRDALTIPLTNQDRAALEHVRRRAAVWIAGPSERLRREMGRAVYHAVEHRQGHRELAAKLAELADHPGVNNDFERVARTELAQAHNVGAYQGLKQQTGAFGDNDPWVYKFVSPGACVDCRRIWGSPGDPTRYKLSAIEAREAAGGNMGRPRAEWGPVIGPVHPNCTEGPLQYWTKALVSSITAAADEFLKTYGGR